MLLQLPVGETKDAEAQALKVDQVLLAPQEVDFVGADELTRSGGGRGPGGRRFGRSRLRRRGADRGGCAAALWWLTAARSPRASTAAMHLPSKVSLVWPTAYTPRCRRAVLQLALVSRCLDRQFPP